jgi:hypothetical protein
MIWEQVVGSIENGNAVIAWSEPNDAGFEFDTRGVNRRVPLDLDGFQLVALRPAEAVRLRARNLRGRGYEERRLIFDGLPGKERTENVGGAD